MVLRNVITVALFFVALFRVSAQFNIGIQSGLTVSAIHIKNKQDYLETDGTRLYYFAGISPVYRFSDKWSAGVDIQYAVRGAGYKLKDILEASSNIRRNNLDFMPKVSYRIIKHLEVSIGTYHSKLLKETVQLGLSKEWTQFAEKYNAESDFGIAPGLRLYAGHFVLLITGQLGLKSLATSDLLDANGAEIKTKDKNRAIQFGLGYVLGKP